MLASSSLLQDHGFEMGHWLKRGHIDGRHGHDRGPLVRVVRDEGLGVGGSDWEWPSNMATDSSTSPVHRSPPGSFEICWSTRPVISAVHKSTCRLSAMPWKASSSWVLARARIAGANDSGDGSNPGSVR